MEAEPAVKAELEEAAAKDRDLKAVPDVAAVAKAESGEVVGVTAEAEPADAELEEAVAVAELSVNDEPVGAKAAKAEPAKVATTEAEPADAEL